MAIASVVRHFTYASIAWGTALILAGAFLFLYKPRHRKILALPILGVLGMTGIPFTPAAGGWPGLIVSPFNLLDVLMLLSHILLIIGYLKHALRPEGDFSQLENWLKIVYPIGLGILVLSFWLIGFSDWRIPIESGLWWAGVLSVLLGTIGMFGIDWASRNLPTEERRIGWIINPFKVLLRFFERLLNLDWFYRLLVLVYEGIRYLVNMFTAVFEGDGGLLWAILFLALLITLINAGGLL
jgi:hypothetical protein